MARVQNTLIGRASGSVGMVVFLTWKLLNVTRSKPTSVSNPQTVLQTQQRNKFAAIVELYNVLKPAIQKGLINRNRKMTLFNFFQYLNQQNAFTNVGGGIIEFIPSALKLSYGLIPTTLLGISSFTLPTNIINVQWSALLKMGQKSDDQMILVLFNITQSTVTFSPSDLNRIVPFYTFVTPTNNLATDTIVLWAFSRNRETGALSDTSFAGRNV